ncbi:endomembrane protein 70, putative [Cryptosporidium muris RN66]|uniref:Transmembrane 9 superfamily member n=1 Tax=Cryptosporidium muris (strain RN66) TaxID=441375 RepID=B6AHN9_CRYMR|nr:endomembrane protein 70, putative [Cryptosporidium muris RN66]EEA07734.1 endomembrane protein 70, putative [Cryptosporidium muris RN66]|eukprot:XP_002142083.1 endomembrane protein 70 [Cryptosporidium muris RN66]
MKIILGRSLLNWIVIYFLLLYVTQAYQAGDLVTLNMNRIWTYNNVVGPIFSFYNKLPLCSSNKDLFSLSLSQILRGDELIDIPIYFLQNQTDQTICTRYIAYDDVIRLKSAISDRVIFEMIIDDMAVAKPLGIQDPNNNHSILINGYDIKLGYKGNSIVSIDMSTKKIHTLDLDEILGSPNINPIPLNMYYSIQWIDVSMNSEYNNNLDYNKIQKTMSISNVRWLGIFNSMILVILILTMLILIFMQVLKSDFSRYFPIGDDDMNISLDDDPIEMKGWKLLHGDIFRPPKYRMVLSSCIGSGIQILVVILVVGITKNLSLLSYNRKYSPTFKTFVYLYSICSFISGYVSSFIYSSMEGKKWKLNMILTTLIYPIPLFTTYWMINIITLQEISFIFAILKTFIFSTVFISFPLCLIGASFGKNKAQKSFKFPCKTNRLPRQIPKQKWWNSSKFHILVSGVIPFSAIYIELHYIFTAFWHYTPFHYYNTSLLYISIVLLLAVGTISSLISLYMHLNLENYKWWWFSYFSGASPCLYFLFLCLYYYLDYANKIFGSVQFHLFILSSLMTTFTLALCTASITFISSYLFIYNIYKRIKSD